MKNWPTAPSPVFSSDKRPVLIRRGEGFPTGPSLALPRKRGEDESLPPRRGRLEPALSAAEGMEVLRGAQNHLIAN